jgi:hypothetical protein
MSRFTELAHPRGVPDRTVMGRWVLALIAVLAASDAIGAALAPYLAAEAPLGLLALNADDRHVVLLASRVPLPWVLAVAIPRRLLSAIAAYGFGACHGRRALGWAERRFERVARIARFMERALERTGAPLLVLVPGYTLGVLSGASGRIPLATFLPCIALGQLGLISAGYFFGDAISEWTDAIVAFFSEHVVESTAACAALVLVAQLVRLLRKRCRSNADASGDSPA